jgi:multidrug efflux pump subunit AcrB
MMPAHVVGLKLDFTKPSRMQPRRERATHMLRVKYTRLLVRLMRHPRIIGLVVVLLFAGAVTLVATGAVRTQFFAFDPIRLFYVNVDMPSGSAIDVTLRETAKVEAVVRRHLQDDEARGVASYAGVKWTDTEPLYGDSYGQVSVSLNPRTATCARSAKWSTRCAANWKPCPAPDGFPSPSCRADRRRRSRSSCA